MCFISWLGSEADQRLNVLYAADAPDLEIASEMAYEAAEAGMQLQRLPSSMHVEPLSAFKRLQKEAK